MATIILVYGLPGSGMGYAGRYVVQILPNIVDVVYGRDVGWTVTKIDLPPEIEAISATQIRAGMKNETVEGTKN